jgi:hypothetical protein
MKKKKTETRLYVELLRVHDYPIDNVMALKLASRPNTPGRIWKAQTLRRSFLPQFLPNAVYTIQQLPSWTRIITLKGMNSSLLFWRTGKVDQA